MKLYNQAELSTLKLSDIADLYNRYASITGDKPVIKFRDKPTAVKRTLEIQAIAAPTAEEPVANPAKKSAKKETKDEPRNFKLSDLRPKENTAFHTLISLIGTGGISEKDLHTSMPGIIESFDPVTQTASIQPTIKRVFITREGITETLTLSNLPLLINVPVQFPRGGGSSLTFPVTKGDECLIRFHSLSDATAIEAYV